MRYVIFSLSFTVLHAVAYTIAGALALHISSEIYKSRSRKMDYLRDMENPDESRHVQKFFFPVQLVRGLLLSVVLYPVLGALGELGFLLRGMFLFGLMFVYTHVGSAAPCPDNLEGFVYLKKKYFDKTMILKFQLEMLVYSSLFALTGSWLLFP